VVSVVVLHFANAFCHTFLVCQPLGRRSDSGDDLLQRELIADSIKSPLNHFFTENCGDVSIGNKEERNL
jgi:hypothetical protein